MPSAVNVTELLARARKGDCAARDAVFEATYKELRRLARRYLGQEKPGHTLQATALVHEVSVRMLASPKLPGENRAQFFAYAAQAMRRILVNHARDRARQKRGGRRRKVRLNEELVVGTDSPVDLVALDEALERLAAVSPRKSRVVELRYFGGLSVEEAAEVLNVSPRTVKRDWEVAGTLLMRDLAKARHDGP